MRKLPAVFMRGGTSKAILFHACDLPARRDDWAPIFLAAMGSPDPNGRQLDGMGGGVSSVSKVCVVGAPSRPDADVDYTFVQVLVDQAKVDYSGNCGNMSSAIGPFAVDEGLVTAGGELATVRIHNTNTSKIIHSSFPIAEGRARTDGVLRIPGVAGAGAPVKLDFLHPGGATTGTLLPTGRAAEMLEVAGVGSVEVSMIDAANACVFVNADAVGLSGTETPAQIKAAPSVLGALEAIRAAASVAMGITDNLAAAHDRRLTPFVVMVGPPRDAHTGTGEIAAAQDVDLVVRALSSGQPHLALPLTVSLCTAVAARIVGSVAHRVARAGATTTLRLGMPSGILHVDAEVACTAGDWTAERGTFFRTARRLFDGFVYF